MSSPIYKFFLRVVFITALLYLSSCRHHKKNVIKDFDKVSDNRNNSNANKINTVAGLLGVDEKEVKKKKIYQFVTEWYGVPYKYGGCDKKGTDCSCFACNLYQTVYDIKLPRTAREISEKCDKVKEHNVREGDLIFFKINSSQVSHVGVYLTNNKFVHASTSKGVIINDINDAFYKKCLSGYGRVKS